MPDRPFTIPSTLKGPVSDEVVDATLHHLRPLAGDLIRLMRLTGARPGDVCKLFARWPDDHVCNRENEVWLYQTTPVRPRSRNRKQPRLVFVGPRSQIILKKYDGRDAGPSQNPLISRLIAACESAVQPAEDGWGTTFYDTPPLTPASLRREVHKACRLAFPKLTTTPIGDRLSTEEDGSDGASLILWDPSQLRETVRLKISRQFGSEAADCFLSTRLAVENDADSRIRELAAIQVGTQVALCIG